jgi:short-subunit dehydrogenase
MSTEDRPLAMVTGASSGIGYELARCCAQDGFDLLIASDEPQIEEAANRLRSLGRQVEALQADLGTAQGVEKLARAAAGRDVSALLANAGHGLGSAFLEQDFSRVRHVIDTNITGTIDLIHRIGGHMKLLGKGRILITGSIGGFMPGSYQAVYNGTKAFIVSFAFALRNELKDSGVTVTCLMPGATDTNFFARAGMLDTKLGTQEKDDPAEVARAGYRAMMNGEAEVVTGLKNKLQAVIANVIPFGVLAKQHRRMAEPRTDKN